MKDYVTYLESITKTLSDASVFSFPVIWMPTFFWLADRKFANMLSFDANIIF
jgi:hypothetical protein